MNLLAWQEKCFYKDSTLKINKNINKHNNKITST